MSKTLGPMPFSMINNHIKWLDEQGYDVIQVLDNNGAYWQSIVYNEVSRNDEDQGENNESRII